jgi:hypothetical protein
MLILIDLQLVLAISIPVLYWLNLGSQIATALF